VAGQETDSVGAAAAALLRHGAPTVGLVLGSGLGAFTDAITNSVVVPYRDIPGMPPVSVAGHAGALHFGTALGVRVACLSGRVHRYEGHDLNDVTFGVRLLARLGCKTVLLTNAAGGINERFVRGDLMLIEDHLNLTGENVLFGPNDPVGPRFLDMTEAYDVGVRNAALSAAGGVGVRLHSGVYAGLKGPSYETPAEVRMLRVLGADAVGMSTVQEVLALRHRGVRVGALSCITNLAAGVGKGTLSHEEVAETAAEVAEALCRFLSAWVVSIAGVKEGAGA
jgi:purine-nucleoside phosphorylase